MTESKKMPYEKPEVVRHGNLKEITMTSFTPPPGAVNKPHREGVI